MDNSLQQSFGLGIKHSIFNNEIRKRRIELGLSQKQLGEMCGLGKASIGHLETFRKYPTEGEALKLAEVLKSKPEVLFPQWLKLFKPERTSVITEHIITEPLLANTFNPLLLTDGQNTEDNIDRALLKEEIIKQLDTLSDRERRVLIERFGIEDGRPKTLEEVGKMFHVTRERIRLTEVKALRKLRHPSRSKKLRIFSGKYDVKYKKFFVYSCSNCGRDRVLYEKVIDKYWCNSCSTYTYFALIREDERIEF